MNIQLRHFLLAAVFGAGISTGFAQQGEKIDVTSQGGKEAAHERMQQLQSEIERLRSSFGTQREIDQLRAELTRLSAALGGDMPARAGGASAQSLPPAPVVGATCNGAVPATTNVAGTNGPITPATPFQGITFTSTVAGQGAYLWDVNLNVDITHTFNGDLDITLESPAGTIVVISTDNGGGNDNVFAGTTFDDNVNTPMVDFVYANGVVAPLLSPEGRLSAFRGENPNGTWKLKIVDDAGADVGNVNSWSLDISTLAAAPATTLTSFNRAPALAVGPGVLSTTDTVAVAGLGTSIHEISARVEITHQANADLDITLTSPAGTVVVLTTDNGGTLDNAFNGTTFDPSLLNPVTDHVFVNLVTLVSTSPEGSFDNFLGQNPNGNWTLTVNDDLAANGGTLVSWDLHVTTSAAPSPSAPANFAGTTGAIPDNGPGAVTPTVFTATVVGAGAYLHDVDLTTFITHTSNGDIDMTLTSPAGTTVVITTDNGGTLDNGFNGTLWDDNANDVVTDRTFTNAVLASPLSPEGRLAAFRGENPNGVWTLTVADDALADNGTLNSWSLGISTLSGAPGTTTGTFTDSPGLAILDVATVSDTQTVAVAGTSIAGLSLFVQITHTFAADMDITLTSPGGTTVAVTTDGGGGNTDVFNGTLFDPDSTDTVTDHVFVNLVVATPLSPEGSFDNFQGQNPNGVWTLTIVDDAGGDVGTLARWDLNITTCANTTQCIAFCFGDGSGTACPCGNVGAPGNGCPHSLNPAGATVSCSGLASISADTFTLNGSGMPSTAPCLYFQGTQRLGGGNGVPFGDGLRCAGGSVTRLLTKTNVGGASVYPGPGEIPISIRGNNVAGNVRQYQVWYRNAANFCIAATFNLTNGVEATWIP